MKRIYVLGKTLTLLWGVLAAPALLHAQTPVGTAFTYQGQIKQAGEPLDDTADFEFSLWNDPNSVDPGDQVGPTVAADNVSVDNGLFTVILDFGASIFTGDARWLEIAVRSPAGGGGFTTLSPRQELTPAPYALYALSGPGSGLYWAATGDDIYNTNAGNVGIGTTSPGSKLDVDGHVRISSGSILSLDGSAVENYLEHVGDGLSTIGTPGLTIRGDEFVSVSCGPGGEVIHIDEYGIVGIGMDNPSSTLDVNGRVESSSGGFRFPDGTTQTTAASGDGHSLDAADGDPVDALYVDNDGDVGIGTPSPSYPLHVEGAGSGIAYVRNNGASGTALRAKASETAVSAEGGTIGLDAFVEAPDGYAVYAFNEGVSGNSYGVFAETASPDGTGVYGRAYDSSLFDSTNIGVHGRADGDAYATGVYGEATNTNPDGITYGVRGVSAEGTGVRGENQATGNYGCLGRDNAGVHGSGAGYDTGVRGSSANGNGVSGDNQTSGNYGILGSAQYGVEGHGSSVGGYFEDTDDSSHAYVGSGGLGIEASGWFAGGRFEDSGGSGYAFVGYADLGIDANGYEAGGHFYDLDDLGYAYVGYGDRGIEAEGIETGGYFGDFNDSGYAYVGYGDLGIDANGDEAGGQFENTANGSITYVADGLDGTGISAYGPTAGGYFVDQDGSGYAYVAYGDRGIEAKGSEAGAYFGDTDGSGDAYVAWGDTGIYARGSDAGGYFKDTDGSGLAYVGYYDRGINAYGNTSGGYFVDLTSGVWSDVAYGTAKIYSNASCYFVQNHPEDPGAVVVYAAPEGNEVATYTRGTARLVNGRARVPLGETFKWVTNPDIGLTAHLTLRGDAPGLYVESLTTAELVVREVGGGTSDVDFDYIVYGLRIGFEEVGIVQEKEREAYIPSMADHRTLYERRPELRDYNALERFKRMRAAAGQTQPLDLSASQALRDAIVEFDPAVHSLDDRRELEASEPIEMGEDRPSEQRPYPPERVEPNDTELAELRDRVETLEALVTRLATSQNGGER
ncbi:MAG: hypothetical protein JSV78_07775 [Phycisphaerales bacterium]|nr:MAG: hypothetical protein JSV78_07775 [Phycisphaerales bacterium]